MPRRVAVVFGRQPETGIRVGCGGPLSTASPTLNVRIAPYGESLEYDSPMIRIAISLVVYQALASTMTEGTARPPEPVDVGEGVGLWMNWTPFVGPRVVES